MTTKLSDAQLVILSTACSRDNRAVFPVTGTLKGGALNKVLLSLIAKGLVEEVPAEADDTIWRDEDEGRVTLRATAAALGELGIEDDRNPDPDGPPAGAGGAVSAAPLRDVPAKPPKAPTRPRKAPRATLSQDAPAAAKVRAGTKQALLIGMLERPEGATIAEIVAATGWQKHTVRGSIAGALKKKLGLEVSSEKADGRGRVYRIR